MTKNVLGKQGIEDLTSADIRCYTFQTPVARVPAGSTVHYISTQPINQPGPTQYYLARVPADLSAKTWDGSGAVWFKISTILPTVDNNKQFHPDGEYIFRVEQIAVHMEIQAAKAQFYIAAYKSKNLAILVNLNTIQPDAYKLPGPAM
ncbi:hypothetical protein VTI74DRAFT_8934 [Chaetomium olivicolor]